MVKKSVKFGKKTCGLNAENLTTVQKTFVFQLWPPANVRELTRTLASGVWLKSRRAYKVRELSHVAWLNSRRELSHVAWLNSRRGTTGKHAGREQKLQGESKNLHIYSFFLFFLDQQNLTRVMHPIYLSISAPPCCYIFNLTNHINS